MTFFLVEPENSSGTRSFSIVTRIISGTFSYKLYGSHRGTQGIIVIMAGGSRSSGSEGTPWLQMKTFMGSPLYTADLPDKEVSFHVFGFNVCGICIAVVVLRASRAHPAVSPHSIFFSHNFVLASSVLHVCSTYYYLHLQISANAIFANADNF